MSPSPSHPADDHSPSAAFPDGEHPPWMEDAVAVVGMAGRFPGAPDVASLWRLVSRGEEGIRRFERQELLEAGVPEEVLEDPAFVPAAGVLGDGSVEAVGRFDAELFGLSPGEARLMDPQHRLLLETAWQALEDAGRAPRGLHGPHGPHGPTDGDARVGVFAGTGSPVYLLDHVHPRVDRGDFAAVYRAALGNDKDFLATRIAHLLDLEGPAVTVGTACSTSLVAVCLAAQSLAVGDCDLALAGGVTLRLPQRSGYRFEEDGILSPDGHCRAFDAAARGTVPGSGVGLVVLARLVDALEQGMPVRAVLRGWALGNDGGRKAGFTAPRLEGQAAVIREAQALAGVAPSSLAYVEAHGTGTRLGDPIEVGALARAFAAGEAAGSGAPDEDSRRDPIYLGSLKSNLGHLDSAAGVAGLLKTVLALEHEEIPPSLHFETPNPELRLEETPFRVAARAVPWPREGTRPRRAAVSSFGIGGTNAHVILEEAPAAVMAEAEEGEGPHLLVLSGHTPEALDEVARRLGEHLEAHPELPLGPVEETLLRGRTPLAHRRALVVADRDGALAALDAQDGAEAAAGRELRVVRGKAPAGRPSVALWMPGQGAQHPGMAVELARAEPVVARELARAAEVLEPELGFDLRQLLEDTGPEAAARLEDTRVAQPVLFAVSHAMARLWLHRGLVPEVLAGHSVGEWVAAHLAGVVPFETALTLLAERGRLVAAQPPGSMAAFPLSEGALQEAIEATLEAARPELTPEDAASLAVAVVNGPEATVAAGTDRAVEALLAHLETSESTGTAGTPGRRLHTSHAFHSPLVAPAAEAFERAVAEAMATTPFEAPRIPILSSVTGTWLTDEEATDPAHWGRQVAAPVRFGALAEALVAEPSRVVVEAGPGRALTTLGRRILSRRSGVESASGPVLVATAPHPREAGQEGAQRMADREAVAALWVHGVEVPALGGGPEVGSPGRPRVSLPPYPFGAPGTGQVHWLDRVTGAGVGDGAAATAPEVDVPGAEPAGGLVKRSDSADWFSVPLWRPRPWAPPEADGSSGRGERWLVVGSGAGDDGGGDGGGEDGFLPGLVAALEAGGEVVGRRGEGAGGPEVSSVAVGELTGFAAGSGGTYRASRGASTDWDAIMADLETRGPLPERLVFLADLEPDDVEGATEEGSAEANTRELRALEGLASLARALGPALVRRSPEEPPVRLSLVTRGRHRVTGAAAGDQARDPSRVATAGAVEGLARVLLQELPGLRLHTVDLPAEDGHGASAGLLEALAAELRRGPDLRPPVALRGGRSWRTWTLDHEPVSLGAVPEGTGPSPLAAPGEHLVVTGGLGTFGLLVAEALVGRGAKVSLLDLRDEPLPESLEAAARAGGGEVAALVADVTDREALLAVLGRAVAERGPVAGVLHAAAVPGDGYRAAADLSLEDLSSHLAPKLTGARSLRWALEELGETPRFAVAASSLAAVLGGIGLAPHGAADGALDALMESWAGAATPQPTAWRTIDWEGWEALFEEGGPAELGQAQSALMLTPGEVVEALERVLAFTAPRGHAPAAGEPRVVVATAPLGPRLDAWLYTPRERSVTEERPSGAGDYVPPEGDVEGRIARVWERVLGVRPVGREDDFFLFGGDSLSGLQVLSALRADLEVELPLESFFEARTVAGMAQVIAAERAKSAQDAERMAAILAEIEGLSPDEVAAALGAEEGP